jgi:hypothetical protein
MMLVMKLRMEPMRDSTELVTEGILGLVFVFFVGV